MFLASRALVLFKPEFAQVVDTTHGRIGCGGDFDEVKPSFLRAAQRVIDGNYAKLLPPFVGDAHFGNAGLSIRSWTLWGRRTIVEWSSRNGLVPPYFFFGPLFTIGGFGVFVVRLPPLLDMHSPLGNQ